MIELTRGEAVNNGVSVQTELADSLPLIQGDRVHLQQVILNLIINAIEAMSGISEGPRELIIGTSKAEPGMLVSVRDSGPGLPPANLDHVFNAFYTAKPSGLGLGCRSAVRSSKRTGDGCGRARTCPVAPFFGLPWSRGGSTGA
jgi:C4-dicarboxylate-specific signal transduction histidine kinase